MNISIKTIDKASELLDATEAGEMTLVCTKCGSGSRIEHEGEDLHCKFCGNVVVEGVKARWPIVEKGMYKPAKNINNTGTKPVVREIRVTEKEEEKIMGKAGKCKVEGCEKNAVSDGLCWKHYRKEHGESYKPKTHRGEKKGEKAKAGVVDKDVFPHLPDDLPVYRRTDFTDHLESLITEKEKQLEALKTVLSIVREAA